MSFISCLVRADVSAVSPENSSAGQLDGIVSVPALDDDTESCPSFGHVVLDPDVLANVEIGQIAAANVWRCGDGCFQLCGKLFPISAKRCRMGRQLRSHRCAKNDFSR